MVFKGFLLHDFFPPTQAITGDMRQVRHVFMKKWMEFKALHPDQCTNCNANKAWLESSVRAQILAARSNKQF